MKKIRLSILTILSVVFILSVFAFASIAPPPITDSDNLKVGTWANILQKDNGQEIKVWIGVVGEEKIDGKRYVWVEVRTTQGGQNIIAKALVRFSLKNNVQDIKKIVVKMGDQPAMEIPYDMLKMMGQDISIFGPVQGEANADIKAVGKETVKVPAGKFVAKHIKIVKKDGSFTMDIWESDKVPINIVKAKTSYGTEILLLDYGKNAKTKITEKPVPFSMENLMKMNKR